MHAGEPGPGTPATSGPPLLARALLALAALCHLSWLLSLVSPSTLPARTSYVSELLADGQPWSLALRWIDVVAGSATLVAALVAWTWTGAARRRGGWVARFVVAAHVGLGAFGLFTVVDAALPMSCAPSVDPACAAAEAAGTVPVTHQLHSVSSTLATTGAVVGLVSAAAVLWLLRSRSTRRHALGTVTVTAAYALVTGWVLVETAGATPGLPTTGAVGLDALGWSHRIDITLSSVCLLLLAVTPSRCPLRGQRR